MKKILLILKTIIILIVLVMPVISLAQLDSVPSDSLCYMRHDFTGDFWNNKGFVCPAPNNICYIDFGEPYTCKTCCIIENIYFIAEWLFVFLVVLVFILVFLGVYNILKYKVNIKKTKKGKKFIIFAIFIGLGALFIKVALYNSKPGNFYSPQGTNQELKTKNNLNRNGIATTREENWQTYRNEEFGFEFGYPNGTDGAMEDKSGGSRGFAGELGLMSLSINQYKSGEIDFILADNVINNGVFYENYFGKMSNSEKITAGGKEAYKYKINKYCSGYLVAMPVRGKTLEVILNDCYEGGASDPTFPDSQLNILNQIISTFKFLK